MSAIHDNLSMPRIVPKPKTSVLSKIYDLIQSIINYIRNFFKPNPFKQTAEELVPRRHIKIMQGPIRPLSVQLPNPQLLRPQSNDAIERINLEQSVAGNRSIPADVFQDAENRYLNTTVNEIVRIASDSANLLYEREVAQVLKAFQEGSKGIPELLKTIAGVVLKLGQAANKHYGAIIEKHDASKTVTNEFLNLLYWLCLNDFTTNQNERATYKDQLFRKLQTRMAKEIRPEMKDYIAPTIGWLSHTSDPFNHAFGHFQNFNEDFAKETLTIAMHLLIESKIDLYSQFVNNILQDNLPQIIQTYLREDVAKMASREEAKHLLTVIKELPWADLIDGVAGILQEHVTGYINAVKAKQETIKAQQDSRVTQDKIALYKARLAIKTDDPDEIIMQANAKSSLEEIEDEQNRLADGRFWSTFSNSAHPAVKAVIDAQLREYSVELAGAQATHEFVSQIADQIIEILLPGDKENIDFWLTKLTIPQPFKDILAHTKRIAQEVVSPAMLSILSIPSVWQQKILDETANIVVMELKKSLRDILIRTLTEKLAQYSDPDEIDEIMADQVLPEVLVPQLIQTAAKHVLFLDIEGFSQEFTDLVGINHDSALQSLQTKFYNETQTILSHVQFASIQMNPRKFNEAIKPFLQDLETRLVNVRRDDPPSFTREKVVILLNKYFTDDDAIEDSRPVYGKLVTELIAEMSSAGGWAKWGIKKSEQALSKILVTSMRDVRTSPEFTLKLLTEKLGTLMAKDKLPELFFGAKGQTREQIRTQLKNLEDQIKDAQENEHPSVDEEAALKRLQADHSNHRLVKSKNKLVVNIRVLSNLIYDIAMAKINYYGRKLTKDYTFGFLGGMGASVTQYIGAGILGTPEQLSEVIMDLYKKLVGDPLRNQSLINQTLSLFIRTLAEKSRRVRHANGGLIQAIAVL